MKLKDKINRYCFRLWDRDLYSWINDEFFANVVKEVEQDISILEDSILSEKVESDSIFEMVVNKYTDKYYPSIWYKNLSDENQEKYSVLREKIDELLSVTA